MLLHIVFDEKLLEDLSKSIKEDGVIQPIIVSANKGNSQKYTLIAGERRWRAAKKAGLKEIPVIIKNLTEQEIAEYALIDDRIRILKHPVNKGLMRSRQTGYLNATGDFITFCDSDDELPSESFVSKQYKPL